uniref:MADS-box protein 32 n=1 Tax=Cunninghamia lanceolata TaxID=28977 RepID=A0A8F2Z0E7_CUNLA|nr:MADS-box protein 32 [Cunninghamia lanceolata]
MSRRKIEIKKIENPSKKQVAFSKRKGGLLKKAKELSILCSADVGLVIFSSTGKLFTHPESASNLERIVERYRLVEGRSHGEHPNTSFQFKSVQAENERLLADMRHLMGENLTQLPLKYLDNLEDDLKNARSRVRLRKHEIMDQVIQRDEESLIKIGEMAREHDVLRGTLAQLQNKLDNCNEGPPSDYLDDNAFDQDEPNHFNLIPPIPPLRLQPSQINLRDADQDLQPELRLGFGSYYKNS